MGTAINTPLVITATPNKSWLDPELPYPSSFEDVAAEAARSAANGAAILHLHATSQWPELIRAVREATPGLIQCGMSSMLLDERMEIFDMRADMISIIANHHDEAFPEANTNVLHDMEELTRYAELCAKTGVRPEWEIWHSGSIWNLRQLLANTVVVRPVITTLFFGWPGGTWSPPTLEEYLYRRQMMPPECAVTVSVMGPDRWPILAAAVTLGDHVRVGTEDYARDRSGEPCQASDLVREVTELAAAVGRPIASVDNARELLQIVPNSINTGSSS
jgi:3-keto-5-aminohexanoate cleavage enzyme